MHQFDVIAKPHPLKTESVMAVFPVGTTLADIVGPEVDETVVVVIRGERIPRQYWHLIKPKTGQQIEITRFPTGKTARKIVGVVLLVVIAMYAPYLLKTMYGAFGIWGAVAAVGITMLATAAAYALIPPPEMPKLESASGVEFNRLNAITGTSNQAVPYGTIPMVLGECRFYPTFAANPYTEILGDKQYLRMLLDLGYGNNMEVFDYLIGETPLRDHDGVEYEISTDPELFSDDVFELSTTDSFNPGEVVLKTTQTNTEEISVDFVFDGGLFGANDRGEATVATTTFTIEYRPIGAGPWFNAASVPRPQLSISTTSCQASGGSFVVRSSARKTLRLGVRWPVDPAGQYELRFTRGGTTYASGTNANARFDQARLAVVRSIKHTNPSKTGTLKLAVRIEATDQLNGVVNQLSVVVQQKIPVYDAATGTWSAPQVSYNPAWIYHWLLTSCPGLANHVDPSRIDLPEFVKWATECDLKGFTCKGVLDRPVMAGDLFRMVLAAGRASFTMRDGLYSVLFDKDGKLPVQHFTPSNTRNFQGQRIFVELPHALRVKFQNPALNWQEDEIIVLDDEHSWEGKDARGNPTNLPPAERFETMTVPFVTEPKAAWQLGRYQLGQGKYRKNVYSWETDIEHLVCNRGDVVYSVNDVVRWGRGFGHIAAVNRNGSNQVTELMLAEPVYMDTTETYSVRVRTTLNNTYISQIVAVAGPGEFTQLQLVTPMGADVDAGDIFMVGSNESQIRELLITKIEPTQDLAATITAVNNHPAVLTYDDNPPTQFISAITGTLILEPPPPPNITAVFSHNNARPPNDGGTVNPGVTVTVDPGPSGYRGGGGGAPPWRNFNNLYVTQAL